MIKIATVCSGIGSPEQALKNLNIPHEIVFACEIDKYARASYNAIHSAGVMYEDMTKEEWDKPEQYADLIVGGVPCQSFSLAGKRLGELDPRGLLFFDFYRYVKNQQPKYFIIENVKGLLSDAGGKTFSNWLLLLGNSVNGHSQMFNHDDSLGYNLHHTVLNSKNFGVPQNRERVFIVGIRSDLPNTFRFPIGWKLDKRLKDVLETDVDEKYYLSDKMLSYMNTTNFQQDKEKVQKTDVCGTLLATDYKSPKCVEVIGEVTPNSQAGKIFGTNGLMPTLTAGTHGYANGYVPEVTNLQGKDYINTIRTSGRGSLTDKHNWDMVIEPVCVAMRGRNPENPNDRTTGAKTEQRFEPNSQGITNTITSVQKDNLILEPEIKIEQISNNKKWGNSVRQQDRVYNDNGLIACIPAGRTESKVNILTNSRIRRLTPLECWRLQAFPDEAFYKAKAVNSDTRLYQQAGNSITVSVMEAIIKNLL